MKCKNIKNKAFTLIELLVVIAVIGLLSTIVAAVLHSSREKAQDARAKSELKELQKAIEIERDKQNKVLKDVTGSGCSACACWSNGIDDPTCIASMTNAFTKLGFPSIVLDPWSHPYLIDENEHEGGTSDCRYDSLYTYGPDGTGGGGDNISISISHFICSP